MGFWRFQRCWWDSDDSDRIPKILWDSRDSDKISKIPKYSLVVVPVVAFVVVVVVVVAVFVVVVVVAVAIFVVVVVVVVVVTTLRHYDVSILHRHQSADISVNMAWRHVNYIFLGVWWLLEYPTKFKIVDCMTMSFTSESKSPWWLHPTPLILEP